MYTVRESIELNALPPTKQPLEEAEMDCNGLYAVHKSDMIHKTVTPCGSKQVADHFNSNVNWHRHNMGFGFSSVTQENLLLLVISLPKVCIKIVCTVLCVGYA